MYNLKSDSRKKVLILAGVIVSVLAISLLLYVKNQPKPFAGEGKFDIGGYSLYLSCEGEGSPTVVFDTGANIPARLWEIVPKEVAKHTRTVVYDRAGLGESDDSPRERTAEVMAEELHELLKKANIKGPFVLVGHSAGGLYIRMFAAKYPKEVAGLIMLDTSNEDKDLEDFEKMTAEQLEEIKIAEEDEIKNPSYPNMRLYESLFSYFESCRQLQKVRDNIKDIPATIIAAGIPIELYDSRLEYQQGIASFFTKGKFVIAEDSHHNIHHDRHELVTAEILEMVNLLKK